MAIYGHGLTLVLLHRRDSQRYRALMPAPTAATTRVATKRATSATVVAECRWRGTPDYATLATSLGAVATAALSAAVSTIVPSRIAGY